jgi:hypothetical protein
MVGAQGLCPKTVAIFFEMGISSSGFKQQAKINGQSLVGN